MDILIIKLGAIGDVIRTTAILSGLEIQAKRRDLIECVYLESFVGSVRHDCLQILS